MPNLRKYEEYASIAEGRLQGGNREKGPGLRSARVPDMVKDYFKSMKMVNRKRIGSGATGDKEAKTLTTG